MPSQHALYFPSRYSATCIQTPYFTHFLSQTRANYVLTSAPTAQLIALACHYLYWACFGAFAALPLAPAAQESLFVALTRCQVGPLTEDENPVKINRRDYSRQCLFL